jgi:trans-aconitate 2-methyltransferase
MGTISSRVAHRPNPAVWNPDQYLKFSQPRLRPAIDLLSRVDTASPQQVVDLGCGTGNVTRLLRERWPKSALTGVDDSPEMLSKAAKELPSVHWLCCSIADWQSDKPIDVIYSNAALHWLDNHETLFPRLLSALRASGTLAIQMPRNFMAPSHLLIADTVQEGPWRAKLNSLIRPPPVSEPAFYHQMLAPHCRQLDIWETEYLHLLRGADPVKEWVKGTWLKQFLDRLDPDERVPFELDYARRLATAYPPFADGTTPFPFRRLFIIAQK